MKVELRHEQILKLLEKKGILSVGELAHCFALSVVTIRKDLDDLASEGLLQRTFGGAVFSNGSLFNSCFRESARQHGPQKVQHPANYSFGVGYNTIRFLKLAARSG